MKIFIKNMVCPRCVMAVENILQHLQIAYNDVKLGEAVLTKNLPPFLAEKLERELEAIGFFWVKGKDEALVEQMKVAIISLVQNNTLPGTNLSDYLSALLLHDYSYLSHLFTTTEGSTIEKYYIAQRIEKVKELLLYNELSLSQIADQLHYSSVAHLSNQFKKVTGSSPSMFKKRATGRYFIDQLPVSKSK